MTSPLRARSISSASRRPSSSSGRPSTVNRTATPAPDGGFPHLGRPRPIRCYDRPDGLVPLDRLAVTGRVFRRSLDPALPVAVEAFGSTIRDATGREYLDAAGGAIVVNVGHGRASIARVLSEQSARLSYAHGSSFTTEPLEAYAAELAPRLPVDDPAVYPVSGGSEAIETALKL